jgi:MFS family permease
MKTTPLSKRELLLGLKYSILEGVFAVGLQVLIIVNGAFVISFARKVLHLSDEMIGLLSALPFVAGVMQPFGSALASQWWRHKTVALVFSLIITVIWVALMWLPLVPWPWLQSNLTLLFLAVAFATGLMQVVSNVAWTSWMGDFVPQEIRGKFFGRRNLVCTGASLGTLLLAGYYLGLFEGAPDQLPWAFAALFSAAALLRFISLYYLKKIPEWGQPEKSGFTNMVRNYRVVLADRNFMAFVWFSAVFGFFLNIAGPFVTVYMLEELKISLGTITLLGCISGVGAIVATPAWGKLGDRFGFKPIAIVGGLSWLLPCLVWLLTSRDNWRFLYALFFWGGMMSSGFVLGQFNILLKLVSAETKSTYISVFVSITCLAAAVAPILGGQILSHWKSWELHMLGFRFTGYHLLIAAQLVPALLSFVLLTRMREPAERHVNEVTGAMRNMREFNPILAFGYIIQRVFTPAGLKGVTHTSWRALAETRKLAREVGEDLAEDALKLVKPPTKHE